MKKLIQNKLYNTETATELASYQYSYNSDFNYFLEALYVTKKGNYFLYVEGGPASKYRVSTSNTGWKSGYDIKALDENEALDWCMEHDEVSLAEERFADFIEVA